MNPTHPSLTCNNYQYISKNLRNQVNFQCHTISMTLMMEKGTKYTWFYAYFPLPDWPLSTQCHKIMKFLSYHLYSIIILLWCLDWCKMKSCNRNFRNARNQSDGKRLLLLHSTYIFKALILHIQVYIMLIITNK